MDETRDYLTTVEEDTPPTLIPPELLEDADPFDMEMWTTLSDFATDSSGSSSYSSPEHTAKTDSSYISITVPEVYVCCSYWYK